MSNKYHNLAKEKGFWDNMSPKTPEVQIVKLALIGTEVSEAIECIREGKSKEELGLELADIIIRTMDLAGALDLDMDSYMTHKHYMNKKRGHKHGKEL